MSCAATPNSACFTRVLWQGEIEVLAVSLPSLASACKANNQDLVSMDSAIERFKNLNKDDFALLVSKGLKVFRHLAKPEELLYLPTGWLMSERSVTGPLIYGARKSFFLQTAQHKDAYIVAKNLLAGGNHSIHKMDEILEIWNKN